MANEPVYVDGGEKPVGRRRSTTTTASTSAAPRGWSRSSRRPTAWSSARGPTAWPGFEDTPAQPAVRRRLRPRRPGLVLPLQPPADDRPGDQAGGDGHRWARRSACSARKGGAAAGRTCTSTSRAGSRRASGARRRATPSSGRPYLREQKPEVVAVARPHHLAWAGEKVVLDGSKSWSRSGPIARFEWTFTDGTTATGPQVERTYDRPGVYSEVLKVTDRRRARRLRLRRRAGARPVEPRAAAADDPRGLLARRSGIKPGDPVTFKVRTFRTTDGQETWDFGDGTPDRRRSTPTATSTSTPRTATPSRPTASRSPATTSSASSGPTAAAPRRPPGCTWSSRAAAPGDPARAPWRRDSQQRVPVPLISAR